MHVVGIGKYFIAFKITSRETTSQILLTIISHLICQNIHSSCKKYLKLDTLTTPLMWISYLLRPSLPLSTLSLLLPVVPGVSVECGRAPNIGPGSKGGPSGPSSLHPALITWQSTQRAILLPHSSPCLRLLVPLMPLWSLVDHREL